MVRVACTPSAGNNKKSSSKTNHEKGPLLTAYYVLHKRRGKIAHAPSNVNDLDIRFGTRAANKKPICTSVGFAFVSIKDQQELARLQVVNNDSSRSVAIFDNREYFPPTNNERWSIFSGGGDWTYDPDFYSQVALIALRPDLLFGSMCHP
jgi:hypothetical protein